MNLTIEIPEKLVETLEARARAQGISPDRLISQILESRLTSDVAEHPMKSLETGYGMWAKYGSAPSADEIDENRREMFGRFAEDL